MNREIKFRVWYDGFMYDQERRSLGAFFDHYAPHEMREAAIMQFTGMVDKAGREIYEGDIVQSRDWLKNTDGSTTLSKANEYMRKLVVAYKADSPFCGFRIPGDCEVIGNVHENPDLLAPAIGEARPEGGVGNPTEPSESAVPS